jgi:hypothetical protein
MGGLRLGLPLGSAPGTSLTLSSSLLHQTRTFSRLWRSIFRAENKPQRLSSPDFSRVAGEEAAEGRRMKDEARNPKAESLKRERREGGGESHRDAASAEMGQEEHE